MLKGREECMYTGCDKPPNVRKLQCLGSSYIQLKEAAAEGKWWPAENKRSSKAALDWIHTKLSQTECKHTGGPPGFFHPKCADAARDAGKAYDASVLVQSKVKQNDDEEKRMACGEGGWIVRSTDVSHMLCDACCQAYVEGGKEASTLWDGK
eukprot:1155257-Pelagomonas_calceolata.AAC.1